MRTDGEGVYISRAHVGLVEHVTVNQVSEKVQKTARRQNLRVMHQAEKVAGVDELGILEEVVEVSAAARGVNPLLQRAVCSVAVVVDGGGCGSLAECWQVTVKLISATYPNEE